MRLLAIGDINGECGREFVYNNLGRIISKHKIDFCVANAENSAEPNGITHNIANTLIQCGADVLTMGNHTFDNKESSSVLEDNSRVIRPINYPPNAEGVGYTICDLGNVRVAVINAIGRVNMTPVSCPFESVDRVLSKIDADITVIDFHADATSEKIAFANYFDGRVSAVFGTHTHVQTADERILPGGTGFICDLGMTGVEDSVLGVKKEIIIEHMRMPIKRVRFEKAVGEVWFHGCIFDIDNKTGRCTAVERLRLNRL